MDANLMNFLVIILAVIAIIAFFRFWQRGRRTVRSSLGRAVKVEAASRAAPPAPALQCDIDLQQVQTDGAAVMGSATVNPGDFAAHDQITQGNAVGGDQITVGHIHHSQAVAIGAGATATVHLHAAAKPRIPLQRPPRAPHFQDRKDDLAQLLADLQAGHVVTLCGPGGIGKSALAAEAVWQLAPAAAPPARFPDGILFHSFYNQPQVALALEHIARSFGEELKPTPHAAAQRALAGRRLIYSLFNLSDCAIIFDV